MAQTIKLKRSAVAAKVPLTTDIALGELAINTYDGKMYFKKNVSGTDTIITLANDNEVVKLTGTQSIAGAKTFSDPVYFTGGTFSTGTSTAVRFNTFSGPIVYDFNLDGLTGSGRTVKFWSASNNSNGGIIKFGTDTSGNLQTTPKGSIQNLGTPINDNDAANKKYVDDQDALKANLSHTHAASDITSGTISTARLGSGTADNTTFLRGDNTWAVPSGGGGAPTSAEYLVKTADATLSAERVVGDSTSITANWTTAGAVSFERAALTGDVTASANSNSTTLANTAVTPGSYTAANITVDSKGRLTAASSNTIPTVNNGTLTLNVSGTGLSGSQTFTANQGTNATFTVTSNATSANTANAIVSRDASGNFNAGTITGTTIVGGTGSAIGGGGLVVNGTTGDNDSQLVIKKPSQSMFGVTSWDGYSMLSTNTHYLNGTWTHSAPTGNTNSSILTPWPGTGVVWYASNNSSASWNVANGLTLWNDSGTWQRPLSNTLTLNTSGTGLSGSTTYNNTGAATFTVASNATSANTVSTLVARDASGNFSAGTITATLSGTASSANSVPWSGITSKPTTLSGYGITDAASSTHTHGNITNAGAIGSTANLPLITTTSGVITTGSFGTTANTFCQGNDSRLSDARTPTTHTHAISDVTNLQTTLDGKLSNATNSTQAGYFGDIYLYDDSTPSHYLQITNSANLTDARVFNLNVNDANRTLSLSGDLTVSSAATISGTNTGDQTITLTGDVTGSGTGSFATTLANSGVGAGTYRSVTVDAKGRVTAGTNPTTLADYGITDAASSTHTHGNITSAGAIGSTANLPIITTTSGVLTTGSFGTTANTFAEGNHTHTLDGLSDVVITSATTGQVLKYNGTNWVNDTDATGGGGGISDDQFVIALRVFS